MRIKYRFIILILFMASQALLARHEQVPALRGGIMDLSDFHFTDKTALRLNGDWEFYWEKLLKPADFRDTLQIPHIIGKVPSYWVDYSNDSIYYSPQGYGTYRMRIIFPEDFKRTLCFEIPVFDCAFEIYFNDNKIGGNGKVGTSRETTEPWYEPFNICYRPMTDTLQILINVANFHHRRGGFWKPIIAGDSEAMLKKIQRKRLYYGTNIGILLFFSIFFLVFRLLSKSEKTMLLFALTALGILMRTVNTGNFISNSFVYTPWAWQIRMEYTGTFIAHIFGMFYLNRIYPSRIMKRITQVNAIITSACIIVVFILPVDKFTYTMFYFQPAILLFMVYYLIRSFLEVIKLKWLDLLFFIALSFFMFALVNDILLSNSQVSVSSDYLTEVAFQVFILVQSTILIKRWVDNYNERLKLNQEIEYINVNLEKVVKERTEELEERNSELESSLNFKNQILSIIAHDLKNPISNLAQFSDILMGELDDNSREIILRSLQESSYAAVNLIDNLLYWGRSQSQQISYLPEETDLLAAVNDALSIFRQIAIRKEIRIIADIDKECRAFCDKALTNIVLRNLISNALKFTPRRGILLITASEKEEFVEVTIKDTGVGMPREKIESFNNDEIIETSTGTEFEKGTGLGLQLVKNLVKINRGKINIVSEPGKGTIISFTLPLVGK